MYSLVLMMALTGGAEQPALFGHGCHGCNGGSCSGCCGGGCCGGSSCHGCHGSRGGHGCHGGHHRSHGGHGCHGCNGGCCGGGCCGGGYGCSGGGYACAGGCAGCYGGAPVYAPAMPGGAAPAKPAEPIKPPKKTGTEALVPAPATIVVSLPAEAKLTVDDAATRSTSATRVFASPALQPGLDYFYTLKAEIVRDGKTTSAVKRVAVHAGEESRISFEFPTTTSVAAK